MDHDKTATILARLYNQEFGGKPSGRYRIADKILREITGRRRLYAEDIQALSRALFEKGCILIDMETFFVVMSAKSFVNYRRVAKETLSDK
ncbi:hypothetical protein [Thalassovita sp.]|uniref:hypothetical protein n=1 Tax=Thalassovita sp. TaxID=1979401 RepID=UPI0029DE64A1|nr:hypothetical protein [Thalassovita sp.]